MSQKIEEILKQEVDAINEEFDKLEKIKEDLDNTFESIGYRMSKVLEIAIKAMENKS